MKSNSKESISTIFENTKTFILFKSVYYNLPIPFKIGSLGVDNYILTFIDHARQYLEVSFSYNKRDAIGFIKAFCENAITITE